MDSFVFEAILAPHTRWIPRIFPAAGSFYSKLETVVSDLSHGSARLAIDAPSSVRDPGENGKIVRLWFGNKPSAKRQGAPGI